MYWSFTSYVKFIPNYFILLSLYRNATDFCILILYPPDLLILFINSSSSWVESSEFAIYNIESYPNRGNLSFSYLVWMLFLSFPCLLTLIRTFSTVLNWKGKNVHSWLVHDLRGNALTLMSMIFGCGPVIHGLYFAEIHSFYT